MPHVDYDFDGALAVLTIVHDKAPVISRELMAELLEQVQHARKDDCRGLLIRAVGPAFLAGADAADLKGISEAEARKMFTGFMAVIHEVQSLTVPTVAAVHGMCLGGGLELSLACDLIVAKKGTMFGQVEARLGGATFIGGTARLAERCGSSRALDISYSGALYNADAFASWGIVTQVVDADNFEDKARALAHMLAHGPTAAHRVTKEVLRTAQTQGLAKADARVLELAPALVETSDMQTAIDVIQTAGSREFMADRSLVAFRGQ
ncbi:enoyl-CoA hydratase/isomerase family protein [Microbacterium karelineae]|uniref:enoyl-CoA hydratase/isomerase family protein n=1 Tax=Microbacterium karelineae TaxID=2654283 RepID=UPI0012EA48F8|nr:enoyl-CoA hydratase/isomerase family protein [Microbacterium karelineae]